MESIIDTHDNYGWILQIVDDDNHNDTYYREGVIYGLSVSGLDNAKSFSYDMCDYEFESEWSEYITDKVWIKVANPTENLENYKDYTHLYLYLMKPDRKVTSL